MQKNLFIADFALALLTVFFYVLHFAITFDSEIIYTVDFIIVLSIIFYAITTSGSFEPAYPFLANNWDSYKVRRSSILKTVHSIEGSSTALFALLTVKQLVCAETFKLSTKVLETATKTNLINTLL